MDEYQVVFARPARKELEAPPPKLARRIVEKIERPQVNPRLPGSRKLEGADDLWRIRRGDYRIPYGIDDRQ